MWSKKLCVGLSLVGACITADNGVAGSTRKGSPDEAEPAVVTLWQSETDRDANAAKVRWLLDSAEAAIVCRTKGDQPQFVRIESGASNVDSSGLIVSGSFSYGTDEVQEVSATGSLMVEWGEEGNYHLAIPGFAYSLFGSGGGEDDDLPSLDDSTEAIGVVFSETETVEEVVCTAVSLDEQPEPTEPYDCETEQDCEEP